MRIYAGNLSYDVTEEELQQEFLAYGEVASASILTDKVSGQPKGFGFVEMASNSEGEAAIAGLNGKSLGDWLINVVEALPLSGNKNNGVLSSRRISCFSGRGRKRRY